MQVSIELFFVGGGGVGDFVSLDSFALVQLSASLCNDELVTRGILNHRAYYRKKFI